MADKQTKEAFYSKDTETVLSMMETSVNGLTSQEVISRRSRYGSNILEEAKQKTLLGKFIDQFKDFMILVLIVAAIISAFFGDFTDSVIILVVVVLNAILGVVQAAKAEKAINALKKMSSPSSEVRRDGQVITVKSEELVPGDIVLLEAGDVVPADLRLIEVASLRIEESALTGESVAEEKNIHIIDKKEVGIGDQDNMAFMNSNVTYGRGVGVVIATGMNTEVGNIAGMLSQTEDTKTPLQQNLNQLGKYLTIAILIIAIIIFVVGIFNGREWLDMLLTSISLAVAAIPEGLPAIVTIILALGTQKMAKRKAIVRHLPAVETLGSTDIICSDKTGTLTMNQMTVEKIFVDNKIVDAEDNNISPSIPLIKIMNYSNDTQISDDGTLIGDPTETALIQFGLDHGFNIKEKVKEEPRINEIPFDSERKLMSTVHQMSDGRYMVATKGAPDELLKKCNRYLLNEEVVSLDNKEREFILEVNHDMAMQALRVLAMAYKILDSIPIDLDAKLIESDLTFAGLTGMIDPERQEAKEAVKKAKEAGIRPIMITGDHQDTAKAIAVRLGIIDENQYDSVISGAELNKLSEEEFSKKVNQYSVYARVSPEHKVRIVKAWQKKGKVVAMTGDGVNDAPALKSADIGIGMGITGTEVSKGASDIILADDNFSTIVIAVEEGRKVFSNIQKAVQYLLSANLGEVLTLFVATMLGWKILGPVHILWINLLTDTFPAIGLGMEPVEKNIMKKLPRGRNSNFFSGGVTQSIIYQGILEGAIVLFVYWWGITYPVHNTSEEIHLDALTMAFATLGLIQLFHAFNVKSIYQSIFSVKIFNNKAFNWAILISGVLLAITILVPGLNDIFQVAHLDAHQWLLVFGASFSIIPIVELVKLFQRKALGKK